MAKPFPPLTWPHPNTLVNRLTLSTGVATTMAYAIFPGRPYVIRGWLSYGTWPGLTVTVSTAVPSSEDPFYDVNSLVPIQVDAFSKAFECTLVSAGQCLVISAAGSNRQIIELAVSAITSHE